MERWGMRACLRPVRRSAALVHINRHLNEQSLCEPFRFETGELIQRLGFQQHACGRAETFAVKSALSIIAFSKSDPTGAIVALLEVALEALDRAGHTLPAAYVDLGLNAFLAQCLNSGAHDLGDVETLQ